VFPKENGSGTLFDVFSPVWEPIAENERVSRKAPQEREELTRLEKGLIERPPGFVLLYKQGMGTPTDNFPKKRGDHYIDGCVSPLGRCLLT